jgi:hypothetical protein
VAFVAAATSTGPSFVLTGGQTSSELPMTRLTLTALSAIGAGLLLASAAHAQAPAPAPQTPAPAPAEAAPPAGDQGGPGGQGGPNRAQEGRGWRHGGGGPMGGMREACSADMKTYCGDAQDRDARRQCMTEHKAQFSQGCQDAIAKMQAWRQSHPRPEGQGPQ